MAELKQNFSQAKMNKDLDERIVPQGQYRDALNIQISTSDGSNVGTAQTLLGNTKHSTLVTAQGVSNTNAYYGIPDTATVVGSIENPATDKIYYFVSGGDLQAASGRPDVAKDYIMQYDTVLEKHKYVFVDIFKIKSSAAASTSVSDAFLYIPKGSNITSQSGVSISSSSYNLTGIRIGMSVSGTFNDNTYTVEDGITVSDIIYTSGNTHYKIVMQKNESVFQPPSGVDASDVLYFSSPRVLNFNKNNQLTAINILDDFMYWTDNISEPKKISIKRSIAGTGGVTYVKGGTSALSGFANTNTGLSDRIFEGDTPFFHTRLVKSISSISAGDYVLTSTGQLAVVTDSSNKKVIQVSESHITVIKRSPTQPLKLDMFRTASPRVNASGAENPLFSSTSSFSPYAGGTLLKAGQTVGLNLESEIDLRVGDTVLLVRQSESEEQLSSFEKFDIRAVVTGSSVSGPDSLASAGFSLKLLAVEPGVLSTDLNWFIRLDGGDSLFEFKFPRFSYRYKYEDGEYSTFAPFSQVAFLTDNYAFDADQAHNLGMINQLRSLKLKGYYSHENALPQDVVEIDILYKETNNPTVYVVKTIKPHDSHPAWPNLILDPEARGEFSIESDVIYAVVPSNQLLRPYDNVPRKAKAQEISANRLIYGNYLQNYSVNKDPVLNVGYASTPLSLVEGSFAPPSVKSSRTYQVGVVFSDKYGRETPVITTKQASVEVPKSQSKFRNRLSVNFDTSGVEIPSWAEYYSFYVKDATTEYYNLTMDRWYKAIDGNIWLSFPSSERNKVDEETYISIKKKHGFNTGVSDKARYKIIAIEGEAPDDIKITDQDLGELINGSSIDVFALSEQGWPQVGATYITVDAGKFEDVFGDNFNVMTPENLRIKFYGGYQGEKSSAEYNVVNMRQLGEDGDYKLKIKGAFGDDCLWIAGDTQTFDQIVSNLSFKLFSSKTTNKPEFDGKFFVKVYKDENLESYILSQESNPQAWSIAASWNLRYINNNGYVNAGTNIPDNIEIPYNAKEYGFGVNYGVGGIGAFVSLSQHPSEHIWTETLGTTQPKYYWGGGSSSLNATYSSLGLTAPNLEQNPVYALNSDLGGNNSSKQFWLGIAGSHDFFIDAATAWSWTGKGVSNVDYSPSNPAGQTDNLPGNAHTGYGTGDIWSSGALPDNEESSVAPEFGTHGRLACNVGWSRGQPSRGIWNNGKCMDISWSGMGGGYTGNPSNLSENNYYPIAHQIKNVNESGAYSAAWKFMRKFVTPGTKFRFNRDPDQTVYTVQDFANGDTGISGWNQNASVGNDGQLGGIFYSGTNKYTGVFGIRNFESSDNKQYAGENIRQRWTVMVDPPIGSQGKRYNPVRGTDPNMLSIAGTDDPDFRRALAHDGGFSNNYDSTQPRKDIIQILAPLEDKDADHFSEDAAVWETTPKDSVDLDIYYQASGLIPMKLNSITKEELIPIGSTFTTENLSAISQTGGSDPSNVSVELVTHTVTAWKDSDGNNSDHTITFTPAIGNIGPFFGVPGGSYNSLEFTKRDYYSFSMNVNGTVAQGDTTVKLHGGVGTSLPKSLIAQTHFLDWNNCWAFGNGVESDRIRDDFNAKQMDNGVKASSVLQEQLKEERRKHGLIWSGIYNSNSGVNDTNQFIQAEAITKDLNPTYGSIQKILNRNTRLILFCEDKVLRAETNKDALYNADGSPQLVSSNTVVGDVVPYQGNYGIGKNPESFVATPYQVYFSDVLRGQVLALSGEGVRSISDYGMRDYFSTTFAKYVDSAIGSYDVKKNEYNLTIKKKYNATQIVPHENITLTYSEGAKGWTSFKSFYPTSGLSINNNYYTFFNGHIWRHHDNVLRNNFYGVQDPVGSSITALFNDNPAGVKSWGAINYEGSEARVINFGTESTSLWLSGDATASEGVVTKSDIEDGEYYNIEATTKGWYVENITTNLQTCGNIEFKNKEGKYFGYPSGETTALVNLDEKEFTVQGLGTATFTHSVPSQGAAVSITVGNNTSTTYGDPDWDATAD